MSLALVQDYASDEEKQIELSSDSDSSSSGEDEDMVQSENQSRMQIFQNLKEINTSSLPSPSDVFSEITGPPDYLKASATEPMPSWQLNSRQSVDNALWPSQNLKKSQAAEESLERRTLRAGAIVEAKAQLVEVHDHVRGEAVDGVKQNGSRVPSVELPPPADAAQLLRMCLQCGVPKTYSGSKEKMVCPVCNDQIRTSSSELAQKRGSNIKDKERSKRMKGQSSHATWKSETEMHLRQQFD